MQTLCETSARRVRPALRFMCLLCAVLLMAVALASPAFAETPAERYRRLKEELEATRQQIKNLESDLKAAKQLKAALEEQKAIIDEMIAINQQEIERTTGELDAKQAEVAQTHETIQQSDALLRQRLVAIYKTNNSTVLSQLLSVDSFSRMVALVDGLKRISDNDTKLLKLLDEQQTLLQAQRDEIDAMLNELNVYHAELAEIQQVLAENIAAADSSISFAQAQIQAQKQVEGDQYAALVQAQKEMQAIAGSIGGSKQGDGSEYVGGTFVWPVPAYSYISCEYGQPDPNGTPHRGRDFAAPAGADILACGGGTVILVNNAHNSYGQYIVVDHGDGVKTLYAHCSAIFAAVGTRVNAGDLIAAVGSTGFSTGNHLHLEVLINNSPVDARGYLPR